MSSIDMPFRGTGTVCRDSKPMRRPGAWMLSLLPRLCGGVLLIGVAVTAPASAQAPADAPLPAVTAVPVDARSPPADVVAAKAYVALERSCARCHQAGLLERRPPGGGIANLLALDEIARDPSLVRPGMPDASRIYAVALTGELHHDALNDPGVAQPTASEIQALREWIAERPPVAGSSCSARKPTAPEAIVAALGRVIAGLEPETARLTRFVSLAHLVNACLADIELAGLTRAAHIMLGELSDQAGRRPEPGWVRQIDPSLLVFAVSLADLGWRSERWDEIAAGNPMRAAPRLPGSIREATGTATPLVGADWLAHAVLAAASPAGEDPVAPAPKVDGAGRIWGLPAVEALAHAWRRPLGIERMAADLWIGQTDLESRLASSPSDAMLAAHQVASGGFARRAAIEALVAGWGETPSQTPGRLPTADRLEIALWPNARTYRAGDRAAFSVATSKDCHLTLINVDRGGRATVLFPNELEPVNLIARDRIVQVPAETAPYRFRFKDKGRETVVAICSTTHKDPAGIDHDYDRLRFTVLGDWQLFLREPPEMRQARRDDAATDVPRPQIVQRRRGRAGLAKADPASAGPDVQTRTAITIDIE